MSSKITTEKFDVVKMERLKHYLEANIERDKPKFYEIFVDNLKAVEKTTDIACFDDYNMYMNEDSKVIKVLIYTSTENSPRNDKFIFTITNVEEEKRRADKKKEELNGIEIQQRIDTAISNERDRMYNEKLKEELANTTKKLEEAEEYIDQLQEQLDQEKTRKYNPREIQIGNIACVILEEAVKRNPSWAKKVPLLGVLSGLSETDQPLLNDGASNTDPTEGTSSFSKKSPEPTLTKEDQSRLLFMKQIETAFTEEQFGVLVEIIQELAAHPNQLHDVYDLLRNTPKQNNKAA